MHDALYTKTASIGSNGRLGKESNNAEGHDHVEYVEKDETEA